MGVGHNTDLGNVSHDSKGWYICNAWVSYPFNRSKATKLAFEVRLLHIIAESRHEKSLVCITANLRVTIGIICKLTG